MSGLSPHPTESRVSPRSSSAAFPPPMRWAAPTALFEGDFSPWPRFPPAAPSLCSWASHRERGSGVVPDSARAVGLVQKLPPLLSEHPTHTPAGCVPAQGGRPWMQMWCVTDRLDACSMVQISAVTYQLSGVRGERGQHIPLPGLLGTLRESCLKGVYLLRPCVPWALSHHHQVHTWPLGVSVPGLSSLALPAF